MLNPVYQSKSGHANASTVAVVFDAAVVKRSLILAVVRVGGGVAISSVADDQGNYYGSPVASGTDGTVTLAFYATLAKTWGTLTVTVTLASSAHCAVTIHEVPNYVHHVAGTPVSANATGTTPTPGTITIPSTSAFGTYNPRHLVLAAFTHTGGSPVTQAVGSGWTSNANSTITAVADGPIFSAWQTDIPDNTTKSGPFASMGSSNAWLALGVTLKHVEQDAVTMIAGRIAFVPGSTHYAMDETSGTNISDYSPNRFDGTMGGTAGTAYHLGQTGFFRGRGAIRWMNSFLPAAPGFGYIAPHARNIWPGNTPFSSWTTIRLPASFSADPNGGTTMGALEGINDATNGVLIGMQTGNDSGRFKIDMFGARSSPVPFDEWVTVIAVDDGTRRYTIVNGYYIVYAQDALLGNKMGGASHGADGSAVGARAFTQPNIYIGWGGVNGGLGYMFDGDQCMSGFVPYALSPAEVQLVTNAGPTINATPGLGDSVMRGDYDITAGVSTRRIVSLYAKNRTGGPTYEFTPSTGNDVANFGLSGTEPLQQSIVAHRMMRSMLVSYSAPLVWGTGFNSTHTGVNASECHKAEEASLVMLSFPPSPRNVNYDDGRITGNWAYKQYTSAGDPGNNIVWYEEMYMDSQFSATIGHTCSFKLTGANLFIVMGKQFGNAGTSDVKVDGSTVVTGFSHALTANDANSVGGTSAVCGAEVIKITGQTNVEHQIDIVCQGGGDSIFLCAFGHDGVTPLGTKPIVTSEMGGFNSSIYNGWVGGATAHNAYVAAVKAVVDGLNALGGFNIIHEPATEVDWDGSVQGGTPEDGGVGIHPTQAAGGGTTRCANQVIRMDAGSSPITVSPTSLSGTSGSPSSSIAVGLTPEYIPSPGADITATVTNLTGGATASNTVSLTHAASAGSFTLTATTSQTAKLSDNRGVISSQVTAPAVVYTIPSPSAGGGMNRINLVIGISIN